MKKYIFLIIPLIIYAVSDYLQAKNKSGYSDEERRANLEKAREQKKAKAVLKDFEQLNSPTDGTEKN